MVKSRGKAPTTPATQALTRLGVPFQVHAFAHDPRVQDYGDEAITALGVSGERIFKTLIVRVDGRLAVAILPVTRRLQLRKLAAVLGARQAELADRVVAERKTGYVLGGISPFGQRMALPMVIDASVMRADRVFVSGGRRGLDLELDSRDFVAACAGVVAAITVGDIEDPA